MWTCKDKGNVEARKLTFDSFKKMQNGSFTVSYTPSKQRSEAKETGFIVPANPSNKTLFDQTVQ